MWNRSYRSHRIARIWAGGLALGTAVAAAICAMCTEPVRQAAAAVRELAPRTGAGLPTRFTVQVPAELGVARGNLIHQDRPDGLPQIIGRVTAIVDAGDGTFRIEFEIAPTAASLCPHGIVLAGARPVDDLESGLRLIVSPDQPRDEAILATEAIRPTVETHVLPSLAENLVREIQELAVDLDERDRELLSGVFDDLRRELAPFQNVLIARLSERAWREVGVVGVAGGVWRIALNGAGNTRKNIRNWIRERFGYKALDDRTEVEFLEEKTRTALRLAIESEVREFWLENREEVVARVEAALAARKSEFATAARERWGPTLFDNAVVPAWLDGEAQVIDTIEAYARDFASRRLASSAGGPRLVFAHTLRGLLEISDAPLLLASPRTKGNAGDVVFQPLP